MARNRRENTIPSTVARFARNRYERIATAPKAVAARVTGTRSASETFGYGTSDTIRTDATITRRRTATFASTTAGTLRPSREPPKSSTRAITRSAFAGVGKDRKSVV